MLEDEVKFGFEQGIVKLVGGTIFRPSKERLHRWFHVSRAEYHVCGYHCEVVYLTKKKKFVYVFYEGCSLEDYQLDNRKLGQLWVSDYPPEGNKLSNGEALEFLLRTQQEIPEELEAELRKYERQLQAEYLEDRELEEAEERQREAKKQQGPPAPRALDFWAAEGELPFRSDQLAHEVDFHSQSQSSLSALIEMIQAIRWWKKEKHSLSSIDRQKWLLGIGFELFSAFEVKAESWWGSLEEVPPESVSFEELPWPKSYRPVVNLFVKIRQLLLPPLSCLTDSRRFSKTANPTAEERHVAMSALAASLSKQEKLVARLRMELAKRFPTDDGKVKRGKNETKDEDTSTGDEPLGERAECVLVAMLELGATDPDRAKISDDISKKAVGGTSGADAIKDVTPDLKTRCLIKTKRGPGGGCWLTTKGRKRAEKLRKRDLNSRN